MNGRHVAVGARAALPAALPAPGPASGWVAPRGDAGSAPQSERMGSPSRQLVDPAARSPASGLAAPDTGPDPSNPGESIFDIVTSIPLTFAIPVRIAGSSAEHGPVRVDQADVVDVTTRPTLWSSAGTWYDRQGPNGAADWSNQRHHSVTTPGIDARNVAVFVWLGVGKIRAADVAGGGPVHTTRFEQRAEQVVIFRPGNEAMAAWIAPGDLYRAPSRITYQ